MARIGSSSSQGVHDGPVKDAPVGEYPARPYAKAITDEHREALAAKEPQPRQTRRVTTTATATRTGRKGRATTTPTGGSPEVAAAVAAEETPTA